MHFLASLHILLTCSFVVLLAYLLSRFFTFLAHSVIHGSSRKSEGSTRSRSSESLQTQFEKDDEDAAFLARLQEEDELENDDDIKDAYQDAEVRTAAPTSSKYDTGGSIFDDDDGMDQEYDVKRDDVKQGSWDNYEEGLDGITGNGRGDTAELEYQEHENGDMRKGENGLLEGNGTSNEIMLGDAQAGSSSPAAQQRLPPTWADLERMVNLNSKKHLLPPSVSTLPEY